MKQLQDDVDSLLLQEEETMNELMMQISSSSGLPNGQGGPTGGELEVLLFWRRRDSFSTDCSERSWNTKLSLA